MENLKIFLGILLVDIVLGGDNAIMIALASHQLPAPERKKAILWGTFGAITLRILLVLIATFLLRIPLLNAVGALFLIYIAVQLGKKKDKDTTHSPTPAKNLREAIRIIIVADLIMSLDNVLALAGVTQGHWGLLLLGLGLSIPCVLWGSQLLSQLMEHYPWITYAGMGAIGWAAARMLLHDPILKPWLATYGTLLEISLPLGVMAACYCLKAKEE